MLRVLVVIGAILAVSVVAGCDRKEPSSAADHATSQRPYPPPPPTELPSGPRQPTKTDSVAEFKVFAAVFIEELFGQSIANPKPKTDFEMHVYKRETAVIDVRRTDSLLSPTVGSVQIKQTITAGKFDAQGEPLAFGSGVATDIFNFAMDGGEWKYINGRSVGTLSKQDVRDVSLDNRHGTSATTLDEDLSNSPRILKAVETATTKVRRARSNPTRNP